MEGFGRVYTSTCTREESPTDKRPVLREAEVLISPGKKVLEIGGQPHRDKQ